MKIQCVEVIDCTHSDDWRIRADEGNPRQPTDGIAEYAGLDEPKDEAVYVEPYRFKRGITGERRPSREKNN